MAKPIVEYVTLVQQHLSPKFRVAEVGVELGASSAEVLKLLRTVNGTFVGVDVWKSSTKADFLNTTEPWKDMIDLRDGLSWEVAEQFPDKSFDFVYIDADHRYSSIIRDIRAWLPKVKTGGIIAGHDYTNLWDGNNESTDAGEGKETNPGVTRAVREVFGDKFNLRGNEPTTFTWWATVGKRKKGQKDRSNVKVSIYGSWTRPDVWQRQIDSLKQNTIEWEIVIAGPNKPDFELPPNVTFIHVTPDPGPCRCSQIAIDNCSGETTMLSADDMVFQPFALDNAYKLYKQQNDYKFMVWFRVGFGPDKDRTEEAATGMLVTPNPELRNG